MPTEPETFYVAAVRRRRRRQLPEGIREPSAVYRLVRPLVGGARQEHFYSILLTTRHSVIAVELVSVGSLNASIVHPREVFRPAILQGAAALIICHNHPSGDPSPSADDQEITTRLHRAGELLGIELLDHVIVAGSDYVSLREMGCL